MVDRKGVIMCLNNVNMFGVPSKFINYRAQGRGCNFVDKGNKPLTFSLTGLNRQAVMVPFIQQKILLRSGNLLKLTIRIVIIIIYGIQQRIQCMYG
jgi:hypothetical protein